MTPTQGRLPTPGSWVQGSGCHKGGGELTLCCWRPGAPSHLLSWVEAGGSGKCGQLPSAPQESQELLQVLPRCPHPPRPLRMSGALRPFSPAMTARPPPPHPIPGEGSWHLLRPAAPVQGSEGAHGSHHLRSLNLASRSCPSRTEQGRLVGVLKSHPQMLLSTLWKGEGAPGWAVAAGHPCLGDQPQFSSRSPTRTLSITSPPWSRLDGGSPDICPHPRAWPVT